jgi:hypothetical protein
MMRAIVMSKITNAFLIAVLALASFGHPTRAQAAPLPAPAAHKTSKADFLKRLRDLQGRLTLEIQGLDKAVRKRLQESTSVNLRSDDAQLADRRIVRLGDHLDELADRRSEFGARREFVDTLIFLIDSKWTSQPLAQFLEHQLLDMAVTEMTDRKSENRLWKFMTYLSITIRETHDPREDVLNIIESYIGYSGVLDPRSPAEFIASRSYTNGSLSYTAKPVDKEKIGDEVEKRLKELEKLQPKAREAAEPASENAENLDVTLHGPGESHQRQN